MKIKRVLGLMGVAVFALISCSKKNIGPTVHHIKLIVTMTAPTDIAVSTKINGTVSTPVQKAGVTGSYEYDIDLFAGDALGLQAASAASDNISYTFYDNDQVVFQNQNVKVTNVIGAEYDVK